MKKRIFNKAQTTIFIIIGILIVIGIIIFTTLKSTSEKENLGREYFQSQGLQPSLNNIQDFIVDCLETTSTKALIDIGIQGGYHKPPDFYFDMDWAFIPYYYYDGQTLMPSKETIENQLSSYIDTNIQSCINEIIFPEFQLSISNPNTKTTITKSKAIFKTDLPIQIKNEGSITTFNLNNHPRTHNSSLEEIIIVADFITESHIQDPDLFCVNCVTELAKENDLYVDFIALEPDTTLVMILENRTMEDPYIFEFLNKYNLK
jgi:hypothetical protein